MRFPSASYLWIASLYRPVFYPGGKVAILQPIFFSPPISNRRISTGLYRLSFLLVLFNDVTSEVAKEARCTPQKYSMGIQDSILMGKKPGHEADHLPPSNVEVKNERSYISAPITDFYFMHRDNFTFTLSAPRSSSHSCGY